MPREGFNRAPSSSLRKWSLDLLMIRPLGRVLLVLALSSPLALFSQEFRAAISGTVTDPSGAPVPGAKITVTETRTQTKNQAVSDNGGKYNVLFLLSGDYDIAIQSQGFKDYIRKALHIGAGDHPVIDVQAGHRRCRPDCRSDRGCAAGQLRECVCRPSHYHQRS